MPGKLQINEKTSISLFAVICTVPFVAGFIFWLSSVDANARAALQKASSHDRILLQIQLSQVRIETELGTLPKDFKLPRVEEFADEVDR